MKRSPMPPRTAQLQRSGRFTLSVGSSDPAGRKQAAPGKSGRSTRKAASDAAMRAVRPALEARAAGLCEVTGLPFPDGIAHAHHRKKRGGPALDVLSNLILVAPQSHVAAYQGSIHAEPARSRRFGWILRARQDPATSPVYRRGRWVLIDDQGGITPTSPPQN